MIKAIQYAEQIHLGLSRRRINGQHTPLKTKVSVKFFLKGLEEKEIDFANSGLTDVFIAKIISNHILNFERFILVQICLLKIYLQENVIYNNNSQYLSFSY